MGWQLINCLLRPPAGESYEYSEGFLKGTGNEQGYYCFTGSPYINDPFISQDFMPHITVDGDEYRQLGLTYNDEPVYGDETTYRFFKSKTEGWIRAQFLREPYYYTDIDETTILGDKFYKGNLPEFNGEAQTWEIAGAVSQSEVGNTIEVKLEQEYWAFEGNNGVSSWTSGSKYCGRYRNAKDGTWKSVGVPMYKVDAPGSNCYYKNEKFTRSFKKTSGKFTYEGDNGHIIHYKDGLWVIGEPDHDKWSECSTEPNMVTAVNFSGYEMDEGTGTKVSDNKGTFTLQWDYNVLGNHKEKILMGEVSIWRPS